MLQRSVGSVLLALVRLSLLAFVWGATLTILIFINHGLSNQTVNSEVFVVALLLMIPSAFVVTNQILKLRIRLSESAPAMESLSTRDLLAILNEEDLDDLRGEIRESLRSRIQRLSDAGPDSFESLLAEAGPKRKRSSQ